MLQCLSKEHEAAGFEVALDRFRAWAVQALPAGFEGCPVLAVAKAYHIRYQFDEALAELNACLESESDNEIVVQAQLLSGIIHFRAGQYDEAKEAFEDILARVSLHDEAGAQALFFTGYIDLMDGRTDKARRAFAALLKRYPGTNYAVKCKDLIARLDASEPE